MSNFHCRLPFPFIIGLFFLLCVLLRAMASLSTLGPLQTSLGTKLWLFNSSSASLMLCSFLTTFYTSATGCRSPSTWAQRLQTGLLSVLAPGESSVPPAARGLYCSSSCSSSILVKASATSGVDGADHCIVALKRHNERK